MHIRILPHPTRTVARGLPNTNAIFFRELPIPRPAPQWPKTTSMAGFEQHPDESLVVRIPVLALE